MRAFFAAMAMFLGGVVLSVKLAALVEAGSMPAVVAILIGAGIALCILAGMAYIQTKAEDIRYRIKTRSNEPLPLHLLVGLWFVGGGADNSASAQPLDYANDGIDSGIGDGGGE